MITSDDLSSIKHIAFHCVLLANGCIQRLFFSNMSDAMSALAMNKKMFYCISIKEGRDRELSDSHDKSSYMAMDYFYPQ